MKRTDSALLATLRKASAGVKSKELAREINCVAYAIHTINQRNSTATVDDVIRTLDTVASKLDVRDNALAVQIDAVTQKLSETNPK